MDSPVVGPVVSKDLIESRLQSRQDQAAERVKHILGDANAEICQSLKSLITEAYMKGMADGFAQGIYANGQMEVE